MNKAFVREPDSDGRVFCPRCGALGLVVGAEPMDTHVRPESRAKQARGQVRRNRATARSAFLTYNATAIERGPYTHNPASKEAISPHPARAPDTDTS